MNIISLVFDAYGGRGGIARYNVNLLKALSLNSKVNKILVFAKNYYYKIDDVPHKITLYCDGSKNYFSYIFDILKRKNEIYDVSFIICGHINLLPIAKLLSKLFNAEIILIIYGVEALKPSKHLIINLLARRIKKFNIYKKSYY